MTPDRRPSRAASPVRRALALGLVHAPLAASWGGAARAEPLDDWVAFDARFIPALAATNASAPDAAARARATAATRRLSADWPALRARWVEVGRRLRDRAAWEGMLVELDGRIPRADAAVRDGRLADAHETLEAARAATIAARRRAGFDGYHLDRMVDYHDRMERLVEAAGAARIDAAGLDDLERDFARARADWRAIERTPPDPARYRLDDARRAQYERGVADEAVALSRLSDALRVRDPRAIAAAALALKPAFARAYTAFGHAPDTP